MVKEAAAKRQVKLLADLAPIAETVVMADERKLKQIMYNLLSNAVKFTPRGGEIRVSAREMSGDIPSGFLFDNPEKHRFIVMNIAEWEKRSGPSRRWTKVSVSDTGAGLDRKDFPKIFEPFDQLGHMPEQQHEGTGLGLSFSKKLVEMHGGIIWVESDGPGRGSCFHFVIPME